MGICYEGANAVIWTQGSSSMFWVGVPLDDDEEEEDDEEKDNMENYFWKVAACTLATLHTPVIATFLPLAKPSPRARYAFPM